MNCIRNYQVPLQKYMAMMDYQVYCLSDPIVFVNCLSKKKSPRKFVNSQLARAVLANCMLSVWAVIEPFLDMLYIALRMPLVLMLHQETCNRCLWILHSCQNKSLFLVLFLFFALSYCIVNPMYLSMIIINIGTQRKAVL